jgi:hypothetical protein
MAGTAMSEPPKIPERPDEKPIPGPKGPQTPYPVNDPPMPEPGTEPDYIPGTPNNPPGQI